MSTESGPRRFLIATAVSHYPNAPEWDRPGLVEARRQMVELFTGRLGYEHVSDLGLNPTKHQLLRELREFCRAPERRPDDIVAVYVAGHGEVLANGEYVLLTSDTEPDDLYDALLPSTLARKILAGTKVRRLLLMLDTCFSGQGGNELLAAMARLKNEWREENAGLALVTSAQPNELARTGAFPELLSEAVRSLATAGYTPELLALDAVVNATRTDPKRPDFQHIGLELIGLTGEIPPFLPNAKHTPRLSHTDLALQQAAEWDEQDQRRDVEFRTRLLRRAMGHRDEDRVGWWFSGRHRALEDITGWLDELPPERPALVVTGDPGSGKTAVLGLLAAVSDPEYRRTVPLATLGLKSDQLPRPRAIRTAVYAQNLTDQQIVRALAAALRLPPTEAVADLLNHLNAGPEPERPHVVLIDGLDEAATPSALCGQVLRPLMELAGGHLRLLLGTRPHLLTPLGLNRRDHIDLDAPGYADPAAVLAYTLRNLIDAHPETPYLDCDSGHRLAVAQAVALAADHSFLVARITAGTLAATPVLPDPWDPDWRRSLPSRAADAMHRDLHQRFGEGARRILDLLRPLAYAEGQGLPWEDIWAPLASELSGRRYTNQDIHALRRDAGAYVVEAMEDGRSVYRVYHEAMAEYLRQDRDVREAHRAFTTTLRRAVPYQLDGSPDWARAHPYTHRHIAAHAARGGLLDGLVADPEFLVHADCDSLVLHLLEAEDDTARLHSAIYRASVNVHRHLDAAGRRQVLALDAARYNVPQLLEALNSRAAEGAWTPVAASGSLLAGNMRNAFAVGAEALACTEWDGRAVVVIGSSEGTLEVRDLTTGHPVGPIMTGHTGAVSALACATLNDRPVAVSVSDDKTVRVWDLSTGRPVGPAMTGHASVVGQVACVLLNGRPVAVTGSDDGTVRIWDLTTGQPVGEPMDSDGQVTALAVAVVRDRPVAIACTIGSRLRVWDLTSQQQQPPLQGDGVVWVTAMACTELDGRPIAVGHEYDGRMQVWDLETGHCLAAFEGHTEWVYAVACAQWDGRPVAISCSRDHTVRIWDLKTYRQVGSLQGHTQNISSLAGTTVAGKPLVVGGAGAAVRIWDLSVHQTFGRPVIGHTQQITDMAHAVVRGRPVFVTSSHDSTVRMWDASTGLPVGVPLTGHEEEVWSVACTALSGRPVAVTTSLDGTVRGWDMETWHPAGPDLTGPSHVSDVACVTFTGRPVVIASEVTSGTVWVRDLETGEARYPRLEWNRDGVERRSDPVGVLLDGRLVAVLADANGIWIRDLATRRTISEIPYNALAVACGEVRGRPVVVTCGENGSVRVWDLRTGRAVGKAMTGHSKPSYWVTCTVLDGRPVALTSCSDDTIRVWDLETCRAVGIIHGSGASMAVPLDASGRIACAFGSDTAVFTRRRTTP